MDTAPLQPPGTELARRNRRLIAERLDWPDGAVQECEAVEAERPDWAVTWAAGGGLTWIRPGFYAHRLRWSREPWLYAATAGELRKRIDAQSPPDDLL